MCRYTQPLSSYKPLSGASWVRSVNFEQLLNSEEGSCCVLQSAAVPVDVEDQLSGAGS